VALASNLQGVFRGREPSDLDELRALELQQSLVAKAIEGVTVNVQQGAAQGSGVIITPDGYVLTAAHVAGGSDRKAWVILNDGTRVEAITLGMNRDKDAGLLKIVQQRSSPWPYASIGRSADLREGQWVIAAGHPGGWRPERGAVIRVGRVLQIDKRRTENEAHTLFTDCALIGGDSGGPLFTLEGKLVGIHSRIGTDVIDNMHVPVDVFASSWDRMVRKEVWGMLPGYQPVIGVSGTKADNRPLIASVTPGGPAHKAGIEVGDLVLAFDDVRISTFEELRLSVEGSMPGDVVVLTVQRGEQTYRIPITVGVSGS
jgi:S1-C subfamily serine protease